MDIADKKTLVVRIATYGNIIACLNEQERVLEQGSDDELKHILVSERKLFEAQLEMSETLLGVAGGKPLKLEEKQAEGQG